MEILGCHKRRGKGGSQIVSVMVAGLALYALRAVAQTCAPTIPAPTVTMQAIADLGGVGGAIDSESTNFGGVSVAGYGGSAWATASIQPNPTVTAQASAGPYETYPGQPYMSSLAVCCN